MTIESLLNSASTGPGSSVLPIVSVGDGISYATAEPQAFVPPNLADRSDLGAVTAPRVIVVSAAGAVGKSTLAREVAAAKQAPLWDLAIAGPVAQYSLRGMFQKAFGVARVALVNQLILDGKLTFVIDALDEARVKTTEGAFEAFIRDIADVAKSAPGLGFVLLGRTQIAETTWLILEDAGVSTRLVTIQPFTRTQAIKYIDLRAKAIKGGTDIAHVAPFAEARDLIFSHLEQAIEPSAQAPSEMREDFLGYAPVLDAIAVLLAGESNLVRLIESLKRGLAAAEATHTAVLEQVISQVLEREQQQKLVKNLQPILLPVAITLGWSDWNILYTKPEQHARVAARMLGVQSPVSVLLPAPLDKAYRDAVEVFLSEHPFLREGHYPANAVFESYLMAWVLLEGQRPLAAAVEGRLANPATRPSRLFADFYLHLKGRTSNPIPLAHVGWLYDAMLSAESEGLRLAFSLEGSDPFEATGSVEKGVEGNFEWLAKRDGAWKTVRDVPFTSASDSVFQLGRHVRRASITLPGSVSLGSSGAEFEIGPNVSIRCGNLELLAQTLVVGGRPGPTEQDIDLDDAVTLESRTFRGMVSKPPVARVPFTVSWPGAEVFPWNEFHFRRSRELESDPRLHSVYRRFRRIVLTLRSHGKGSLARTRKKIENERVMQGPMGQALLDQLVGDDVLVLHDGFYHWNPERAAESVGITYPQLRAGEGSKRLLDYLRAFIDRNGSLF